MSGAAMPYWKRSIAENRETLNCILNDWSIERSSLKFVLCGKFKFLMMLESFERPLKETSCSFYMLDDTPKYVNHRLLGISPLPVDDIEKKLPIQL